LPAFFLIRIFSAEKAKYIQDPDASIEQVVVTYIYQIIFSIAIVLVNILIELYIVISTQYERQMTDTERELSIIAKMTLLKFLTSFLLPLLSYSSEDQWFEQNGLINEVTIIVFLLSFGEAFRLMVNWGFIFKLIIRKYEERKAEDSEITQKKANELEENDPIEIGKTMSIILVFTFNILFFAPIIPGLVIIGIIGIIVLYWVMKYLMISRQIVKYALSSKLVITATEFIKVGILANAIMAFYFYSRLLNRLSIPATIQLTISLIFFVVPIKRIIIKRYYTKEGEEDFRKFEEVSAGLRHYDVTNPVTRSLGFSRLEGKRFQDVIRRCIIKKLKNSVAQGGGLEV